MSALAEALARQFSEANSELIALLEQAAPDQWRARTADEGEMRAVGIITHHVAWAHRHIARRVKAFAHGSEVPARHPELFDERNARHARENPDPNLRMTIELLREDRSGRDCDDRGPLRYWARTNRLGGVSGSGG
jgi:hypothetical protein